MVAIPKKRGEGSESFFFFLKREEKDDTLMNSSSKKLTSKDCELVSYGLSRWLRTESPRGKTLKGNQ